MTTIAPLPPPDLAGLAKSASDARLTVRRSAALLRAATAAGAGSLDERLVRLMVWTGAAFPSKAIHSGLVAPLDIIDEGTAWCDQAVKVFLWAVRELYGFPGRELAIWHLDARSGHTVAEVYYDEAWHLYDVHIEHCAVYRDETGGRVLSYAELCMSHGEPILARHHWWRATDGTGKEGFFQPASKVTYYGRDGLAKYPDNPPESW